MTRTKSIDTLYTGAHGRRYVQARQSDLHSLGYEINADYFRPYVEPTDELLDFGCGNGGVLIHLVPHVKRAVGVEINKYACDLARGRGLSVFANFDELEDESFDVIISNHVLEHIPDVPRALARLHRLLRPSGRLVLKLPIDDYRARHQRSWARDDVDGHLHTWSPRLIANNLYICGYDVREIKVLTSAWHPALFPLIRVGMRTPTLWLYWAIKRRRQLFVVALRE